MKWFKGLTLAVFLLLPLYAQSDLQKVVDTEHAFAQFAEANSTKDAFLQFISEDGVLFQPEKVNGKAYWNGRGPSRGLLSWAPNYADVSANGILGYTTGNWEFRPTGKDSTPSAFGEFITVWVRQPDGKYKFVVDIGVGHEKPARYSADWVTAADTKKDINDKNSSAADNANGFYALMTEKGIGKAYETFAVEDLRAFREGKEPFIGRSSLLSLIKSEKATFTFPKRSSFFGSADLAYNLTTYSKSIDGKVVENGNTMQIWKLVRGRWRIVLDIFKPVPPK